jgi:hypothetical protein
MLWIAKYAVEHQCVRFDWTVDASNTSAAPTGDVKSVYRKPKLVGFYQFSSFRDRGYTATKKDL